MDFRYGSAPIGLATSNLLLSQQLKEPAGGHKHDREGQGFFL